MFAGSIPKPVARRELRLVRLLGDGVSSHVLEDYLGDFDDITERSHGARAIAVLRLDRPRALVVSSGRPESDVEQDCSEPDMRSGAVEVAEQHRNEQANDGQC